MPLKKSMLFGRVEVKCWGNGYKGSGCARSRVGMTGWGDVEAEEVGQKVGAGSAGPLMRIFPSAVLDVGSRVTGSTGLEVKSGVW